MPSTTPLRLLHAHGNVNGGVLGDSVQTRLQFLHEVARRRFEFIDRIAMALYDPAQDLLKTFASSDGPGQPLVRYEAHQADVPSLRDLATQRRARVVDDIAAGLAPGHSVHGQWLSSQRYRSSYTRPVFHGEELAAFLFFDSRQPAAFNAEVTGFLELFADLVAQAYLARLAAARTLIGSINLACGLAGQRDSETGQHLRRIGLFSRLIARRMAPAWQLGDEFIEYLYLFAPLHDIGKIGIPDRILQKPGRLDEAELALMRTHVDLGVDMVDHIIHDLGLGDDGIARMMRRIVGQHHERCDGSGYPAGLVGEQIAPEARIVAVADVYDALSSARHYKSAWDADDYAAELRQQARDGKLDAPCVEALLAEPEACAEIRQRYADPPSPDLARVLAISHADVLGRWPLPLTPSA